MFKTDRKQPSFRHFVKSIDLFGHPVQLNYQKDKQERKTVFGGACSILIIFFMVIYIVLDIVLDWVPKDSTVALG